jgi:hypothetical protein
MNGIHLYDDVSQSSSYVETFTFVDLEHLLEVPCSPNHCSLHESIDDEEEDDERVDCRDTIEQQNNYEELGSEEENGHANPEAHGSRTSLCVCEEPKVKHKKQISGFEFISKEFIKHTSVIALIKEVAK